MTTTLDIIKNAEKTDALELQNSVNSVLSKKAFERLETMKRDIASNMLTVPETQGEEE